MKILLLTAAATSIAATAALAQPAPALDGAWMSIGAVTSKLEAQGYTIREIERDDGHYEVEMTGSDGIRWEADIHRSTGEIVKRERDDD